MNEIESWYDNEYDEWSRLDRHNIEFEITKRYMDEYIIGENLEIFDIGGGPGRYSFYLANKGHQVTLLDLSQNNLNVAKEKESELGITLKECMKGNALDLGMIEKEYDVVLLMGPLYHLVKEADRKKALEEAIKKLKVGGVLIAAFISKYAPIQDYITNLDFGDEEADVNNMIKYLKNGVNDGDVGFTTAYFTGADEAKKLMEEAGLEELVFAGVENILGCKEREILNLAEDKMKNMLNLGFALSQDESLYGTSQHFLYIGRK